MSDKNIGDTIGTFSVTISFHCTTGAFSNPFISWYYNAKPSTPLVFNNATIATDNAAIGLTLQTNSGDPAALVDGELRIYSDENFTVAHDKTATFTAKWNLTKIAETSQQGIFTVQPSFLTDHITLNRPAFTTDSRSLTIPSVTIKNIPKCSVSLVSQNIAINGFRSTISELSHGGTASKPIPINLENCGNGRQFNFSFSGDAADASQGILRPSSGSAHNVGFQLLKEDGHTPIQLNQAGDSIIAAQGNMTRTFYARMVALPGAGAPTEGDLTAIATFQLNYP